MDFKEKIEEIEYSFIFNMNIFMDNNSYIFKIINNNILNDRYYECLMEFKNLKSRLYSDAYIRKLMYGKKNKKEFVANIYKSRALGCLAIVDAIDKLDFDVTSLPQIKYNSIKSLKNVRLNLLNLASKSIEYSNEIAKSENLHLYNFDVSKKYNYEQ